MKRKLKDSTLGEWKQERKTAKNRKKKKEKIERLGEASIGFIQKYGDEERKKERKKEKRKKEKERESKVNRRHCYS